MLSFVCHQQSELYDAFLVLKQKMNVGKYDDSVAIVNHTKNNHTPNTLDQFTISFVPHEYIENKKDAIYQSITDLQYMCFVKYLLGKYPWHLIVHKPYNEAFADVLHHLQTIDHQNTLLYQKAIEPKSPECRIEVYFHPLFLKTRCDAFIDLHPFCPDNKHVLLCFASKEMLKINVPLQRPYLLIIENQDHYNAFKQGTCILDYINVDTYDALFLNLTAEDVQFHPCRERKNKIGRQEYADYLVRSVIAYSRSS